MNNIRKRNELIRQRAQEGKTNRELALKFRLSRSRIQNILQEFEAEEAMTRRRIELRKAIATADDIDQKWSVEDLLDAIHPIPVAKTALSRHFKDCNQNEISLREMMDIVIAPSANKKFVFNPASAQKIYCFGKYGFFSMVKGITEMDLGPKGNQEWNQRLDKLRRHWHIDNTGSY
jgi:hypothetical protein